MFRVHLLLFFFLFKPFVVFEWELSFFIEKSINGFPFFLHEISEARLILKDFFWLGNRTPCLYCCLHLEVVFFSLDFPYFPFAKQIAVLSGPVCASSASSFTRRHTLSNFKLFIINYSFTSNFIRTHLSKLGSPSAPSSSSFLKWPSRTVSSIPRPTSSR